MRRVSLAMSEPLWEELTGWLASRQETAGVLTARLIDDPAGLTMLGRDLLAAPQEAYTDRQGDSLSLRSTGWVPSVRAAQRDGSIGIFVHSHPGGVAAFSELDDQVDDQLWKSFVELTATDLYASVVIAGSVAAPSIKGRVRLSDGCLAPIHVVRIVGDRLTLHLDVEDAVVSVVHDRQVQAFGATGQQLLARMNVGVVGAGGTGSAVAEQLLRLGVGHLTLADDDVVTPSTISRGFGSGIHDVGRPKVAVIDDLANRIGVASQMHAIQGNIRDVDVIQAFSHCDVIFACTDGHASRLVLNRWAYWHLAPVIDVAVLVTSTDQRVEAIDGRLTWLSPGAACLLCRNRIEPALAYAEQLEPSERRRLAAQGYVPGVEEANPSIVPYTASMAGMATTELLNRLFGFADSTPSEILVQFHARTTSQNRRAPRQGCFCGSERAWGQGFAPPYLDLTWAG